MTRYALQLAVPALLGTCALFSWQPIGFSQDQTTATPPPPPTSISPSEREPSKGVTPQSADKQVPSAPLPQPEGATLPPNGATAAQPEPEYLNRGPVHEAFARPFEADPEPGVIAPAAPPTAVDELPPESMPEGQNVQWIPGYWSWDDEREDFVWVSGLWRDVPPGQRWVPGYWTEAEGGAQWVAGFWTAEEGPEIAYLPPPPQSLEQGPNIASPGDDYFWIPGCWISQNSAYRWRPGYWTPCQNDWVWSPDCYRWTPRGCVFTRGYWDYRFPLRGTLFAPVFFPGYRTHFRGYRFTPGYSIALGDALVHLFVRPRFCNYFFGNYYGPNYLARGLQPWNRGFGRNHYDPLLVFYRTQYRRQGLDFDDRLNRWHNYYDQYPDRRPPLTVAQTRGFLEQHRDTPHINNAILAKPLQEVVLRQDRDNQQRFRTLTQDQRRDIGVASQDFRNLERQRSQFERTFDRRDAGDADTPTERSQARVPTDRAFDRDRTFPLPQDRTLTSRFSTDEQRRLGDQRPSRFEQSTSPPDRSLESRSQFRVPERPDTARTSPQADQARQRAIAGQERSRSFQSNDSSSDSPRSRPDFNSRTPALDSQSPSRLGQTSPPSISSQFDRRTNPSSRQGPSFGDGNTRDNRSGTPFTPSRPDFGAGRIETQSRPEFSRTLPQSTPESSRNQPQFGSNSSRSFPQSSGSQPQFNRSVPQSTERVTTAIQSLCSPVQRITTAVQSLAASIQRVWFLVESFAAPVQ